MEYELLYEPEIYYHLWQRVNGKRYLIEEFKDLDDAKKAISEERCFRGNDLYILEVDIRSGKEDCIFCADWDEDEGRYV